ncbi:helix-turn-helix domain-containing protein [Actinosynnema sp. NPDC020468]|uniref:AraC-like ligand-binding domain-containing protein n=1 Tax=Actinosynnema sp. NPDC020468 TaxID=3154488 RepID=UPI0033F8E4BA
MLPSRDSDGCPDANPVADSPGLSRWCASHSGCGPDGSSSAVGALPCAPSAFCAGARCGTIAVSGGSKGEIVLELFDSDKIPGQDRAEAWRDVTGKALVTTEFHVPEATGFHARLGVRSLGIAQVTGMSYTSLSSRRTYRAIRRSDPELCQVGLVRSGRQGIEQNRRNVVVDAGELVVYDSSRPFEARVGDSTPPAESVVLQFRRRLLPLPAHKVARLLAVPLPATTGIGRLLTGFLVALTDDRGRWTEHDAHRLGPIAIDLVSAWLAHHLDDDTAPPGSPSQVLYLRVKDFVEENLHRPDLDPPAIAAAHHISVRYLHRIFQQHHDTGVDAHVRHRRLDRCRRDLADPALRHLTIAAIAARRGFTRPADFSRAFRRETGLSPSEFRAGRAP